MLLEIKRFHLRALRMVSDGQPANSQSAKEVHLHIHNYTEVFVNTQIHNVFF